jgi:serine/threonine protein kinase
MTKTEMIRLMKLKQYRNTGKEIEIYNFGLKLCYFIHLDYDDMSIMREIFLLRYMGQQNIQKMHFVNLTKDRQHIYYTNYVKNVSMKISDVNLKQAEKIMMDVGAAMCYLHHKNIIHENITLNNITKFCVFFLVGLKLFTTCSYEPDEVKTGKIIG